MRSGILGNEVILAFEGSGESPRFMQILEMEIYDWVRRENPALADQTNRQLSRSLGWDYQRGVEPPFPLEPQPQEPQTQTPLNLLEQRGAQVFELDSGIMAPETLLSVIQKIERDTPDTQISTKVSDGGVTVAFPEHSNPQNFLRSVGFEVAEQARIINPALRSQPMEKILEDYGVGVTSSYLNDPQQSPQPEWHPI